MASSVWSSDFYFNGVHSSRYDVCVVDYNEKNIVKQVLTNTNISLEKENTLGNSYSYKESDISSDNLILQLAKTNKLPWTTSDLIEIGKWFFTENFAKLQVNEFSNSTLNIVYYVKAVNMRKFITPSCEGYIEVELMPFTPYAYVLPVNTFILNNGETKVLNNYSNLYTNYKPKIKVVNLGTPDSVINIKNTAIDSLGLEIRGLNTNETVIIDCKMGTVMRGDMNRFDVLQNYNFIELKSGNNNISLSGEAMVEFICEYPIII